MRNWTLITITASIGAAVAYILYIDYRSRPEGSLRTNVLKNRKATIDPDTSDCIIQMEPVVQKPDSKVQKLLEADRLIKNGDHQAAADCYNELLLEEASPETLLASIPAIILQILIERGVDLNTLVSGNVSKICALSEDRTRIRYGLKLKKNVFKGEVVYIEQALVASLQNCVEGKDYCSLCLKAVNINDEVQCCKDLYCSELCREKALYHNYFCKMDPKTNPAAGQLARFIGAKNQLSNKLAIKLCLIKAELIDHVSLGEIGKSSNQSGPEEVNHLEAQLLRQTAELVDGFSDYYTNERYTSIKNKVFNSSFSIPLPNGETLSFAESTEEHGRGSFDGTMLKGSGLYPLSSSLAHSCSPNTVATFPIGSDLNLIALEDLAAGSELFISYINPKQSKSKRRSAMKHRFGIICRCSLCSS